MDGAWNDHQLFVVSFRSSYSGVGLFPVNRQYSTADFWLYCKFMKDMQPVTFQPPLEFKERE